MNLRSRLTAIEGTPATVELIKRLWGEDRLTPAQQQRFWQVLLKAGDEDAVRIQAAMDRVPPSSDANGLADIEPTIRAIAAEFGWDADWTVTAVAADLAEHGELVQQTIDQSLRVGQHNQQEREG